MTSDTLPRLLFDDLLQKTSEEITCYMYLESTARINATLTEIRQASFQHLKSKAEEMIKRFNMYEYTHKTKCPVLPASAQDIFKREKRFKNKESSLKAWASCEPEVKKQYETQAQEQKKIYDQEWKDYMSGREERSLCKTDAVKKLFEYMTTHVQSPFQTFDQNVIKVLNDLSSNTKDRINLHEKKETRLISGRRKPSKAPTDSKEKDGKPDTKESKDDVKDTKENKDSRKRKTNTEPSSSNPSNQSNQSNNANTSALKKRKSSTVEETNTDKESKPSSSKKAKKNAEQPKLGNQPFTHFRKRFVEQHKEKGNMNELKSEAGQIWKNFSAEEKKPWIDEVVKMMANGTLGSSSKRKRKPTPEDKGKNDSKISQESEEHENGKMETSSSNPSNPNTLSMPPPPPPPPSTKKLSAAPPTPLSTASSPEPQEDGQLTDTELMALHNEGPDDEYEDSEDDS